MPTKRRRVTRGRRGAVTMDSLPFECLLEFSAGWHPPRNEFEAGRSYWQTWEQFMDTWLAVRDEYMRHEVWRGDEFAERVYQTFGAKGPPADITYEELRAAIDAAEDDKARELLRDIEINGRG